MFKQALLVILVLLVAWFSLLGLISALASDETKLTWMLEDMETGYNRGNVRDTTGSLSADWSHAGHPVTRRDFERGLAAEFFQNRSPKTKQLTSRAVVDWDTLLLDVVEDSATFELELVMETMRDEAWAPAWGATIRGEAVETDSGWSIRSTSHEDREGTLLSR